MEGIIMLKKRGGGMSYLISKSRRKGFTTLYEYGSMYHELWEMQREEIQREYEKQLWLRMLGMGELSLKDYMIKTNQFKTENIMTKKNVFVKVSSQEEFDKYAEWRRGTGDNVSGHFKTPYCFHSITAYCGWDVPHGPVERKSGERDWITFEEFTTQYLKPTVKLTPQQLYKELFKKWLEVTGVKVGSYVTVISDYCSHHESETGHQTGRSPSERKILGEQFKVNNIEPLKVCLDIKGDDYYFDFRALEPAVRPVKVQSFLLCGYTPHFNCPRDKFYVTESGLQIEEYHWDLKELKEMTDFYLDKFDKNRECGIFTIGRYFLACPDFREIRRILTTFEK